MISVQSSGSIVSAIAVEPLTSLNSIVTTRRSPAIARPARAASSLASSSRGRNGSSSPPAAASSRLPHTLQNREPSGFMVPHAGQFIGSPTPLEGDPFGQQPIIAERHHDVVGVRVLLHPDASLLERVPAEPLVERDRLFAAEEHAHRQTRGLDVARRPAHQRARMSLAAERRGGEDPPDTPQQEGAGAAPPPHPGHLPAAHEQTPPRPGGGPRGRRG